MKIIDSHIHIGKWSGIFYNYESSVAEAIDVMKRSGVEAAVCMPTDITGTIKCIFKKHKIKGSANQGNTKGDVH